MRYILLVLFAFVTAFASAQVQFLGSPTTTVRNRGNFVSDSLFYLPKRTKAPSDSGALRYQISDSALYVWTGSQWIKAGGGAGSITGTLTTNYLPKATGSTTLGNSVMYDSSSHVRVYGNWLGSGNSNRYLFQTEVDGQNGYGLKVQQNDSNDNNLQWVMSLRHGLLITAKPRPEFGVGHDMQLPDDAGTFRRVGSILTRLTDTTAAGISAKMQFGVAKSGTLVTPLQIYSDSSIRIAKLAGSGTRYVVADANGDLTATSATSSTIGGSGTTNYIPKFTASTTLGNSLIYDNGTSVGIGTTSPSQKLEIDGKVYVNTANPDVSGISINASTGTNAAAMKFSNTGGNLYVGRDKSDGSRITGIAYANTIWAENSYPLIFGVDNAEKLRITSSGELLIGTTSDAGAYALQVAGSIYNTTGAVLAASSGNVGIGTTSPSAAFSGSSKVLHINDNVTNNAGIVRLQSGSANVYGELYASTNQIGFYGGTADPMAFWTNGTERMRITSAGNVGIGITDNNPLGSGGTYRNLMVGNGAGYGAFQGVSTATAAGSTVAVFSGGTTGASGGFKTAGFITVDLDGTSTTNAVGRITFNVSQSIGAYVEAMRITSAGELLLGGTTDVGAYVLQAFGGFYNSGNALLNAASGETWIGGTDYGNYQLSVSNNMYVDGQSVLAGNGAAEVLLGTTSDAGTYRLQVAGNVYSTGTITTAAPSGGTAKPFKIGAAATVSPTSPNRTIEIEIDGTTYYLHAKTTND